MHSVAIAHQEVEFVQEFGGKGEQGGHLAEDVFIAFDRQGGIYITDTDNFRLQKLNSKGQLQFEIKTIPEQFRLINPTDIAVSEDGTIYVMDWVLIPIEGADNPRIYNYGPCVHRFDSEGKFVASYPVHDFSRRIKSLEAAHPGLDAEGNYVLVIPQGNTERSFLLTVDRAGSIYVLDTGIIHKLDVNGNPISNYAISQPRAGQVIQAADMAVDHHDNLYLVDRGSHRVLKYNSEGEFLTAFGQYGDRAGQFTSPFLILTFDDGTLLVADQAKYKIDNDSDLPRRQYDPFQFGGLSYRVFRTRLRRVQRFTADGENTEKILIRFSRENEAHTHLRLKAIDYSGNLYFLDVETLKFKKFALTSALVPSVFQTEAQLRYTAEIHDIEIDNQDDLDADFFTRADFDQRLQLHEGNAKVTLAYIVSEDLRCSISNTFAYFWMSEKSFYRARVFEDFRGSFNQDDESTQTFWDDRVQIDVAMTREHSPYRYREAKGFVYFNVTRNDFVNDALDPRNFRFFTFNVRISDWGGGVHYDISKAFRLQFEVNHFFGYNTYKYADETDILYATGFQESDSTLALLTVDGMF